MNKNKENKNLWDFSLRVIIVAIAVLFILRFDGVKQVIGTLFSLLTPFFIGFALAYVWNLLLRFLEKHFFPHSEKYIIHKIRRPVCIVLSILIIIGFIAAILYLIIPQLYESLQIIFNAIPVLAQDFRDWFLEVSEGVNWMQELRAQIQAIDIDWTNVVQNILGFLRNNLGGLLGSTVQVVGSVVGFFITFITVLIFAIYLLVGREKLHDQVERAALAHMSRKNYKTAKNTVELVNNTFSNFFKGQILDAFVVGAMLFVVMLVLGLPYPATISVVVMVMALIPMVGSLLGGFIGFIMIVVVNPEQAFLFVIALILIQQLEGDVIYPRIVGDQVGLPGIWTFAAVFLGGALGGALGMILGVPIFASIYKLYQIHVYKKLREKMQIGPESIQPLRDTPKVRKSKKLVID